MNDVTALKRAAAEHALDTFVEAGMRVGLGSGSTAEQMLEALAERLADGRLSRLGAVASSKATAASCRRLGIPLGSLRELPELDVVLDGADEIDPRLRLIKGLGGALLREKVVASAGRRMVVIADGSKLVDRLGRRAPLPVEVIEFARPLCERRLSALGWRPELRQTPGGDAYLTDQGNPILDCHRDDWSDPELLAADVRAVPGVVEHGLFLGLATAAVVATRDGVRTLEAPAAAPSR